MAHSGGSSSAVDASEPPAAGGSVLLASASTSIRARHSFHRWCTMTPDDKHSRPTRWRRERLPTMSARRRPCLLLVHAHPDDECLATGGTIAKYSDAGARVVLVTCTNGEVGE